MNTFTTIAKDIRTKGVDALWEDVICG